MKKPLVIGILTVLTAGGAFAFMGCNPTNSCQCVQTDFHCAGLNGGCEATYCGWSCNTDCYQCSYYPFLIGCFARDWYTGDNNYENYNFCHDCTGCAQCSTKGSACMCSVFGFDIWNLNWAEAGTEYGYNSRYAYKEAKYNDDYVVNDVYFRFISDNQAVVTVDWTANRPICAGYLFVDVGRVKARIPIGYIDANNNVVFKADYIISPGQHYISTQIDYTNTGSLVYPAFDQFSSSLYYFVEK